MTVRIGADFQTETLPVRSKISRDQIDTGNVVRQVDDGLWIVTLAMDPAIHVTTFSEAEAVAKAKQVTNALTVGMPSARQALRPRVRTPQRRLSEDEGLMLIANTLVNNRTGDRFGYSASPDLFLSEKVRLDRIHADGPWRSMARWIEAEHVCNHRLDHIVGKSNQRLAELGPRPIDEDDDIENSEGRWAHDQRKILLKLLSELEQLEPKLRKAKALQLFQDALSDLSWGRSEAVLKKIGGAPSKVDSQAFAEFKGQIVALVEFIRLKLPQAQQKKTERVVLHIAGKKYKEFSTGKWIYSSKRDGKVRDFRNQIMDEREKKNSDGTTELQAPFDWPSILACDEYSSATYAHCGRERRAFIETMFQAHRAEEYPQEPLADWCVTHAKRIFAISSPGMRTVGRTRARGTSAH